MPTLRTPDDATEAQRLLDAAATADAGGMRAASGSRRVETALSVAIGLLLGSFLIGVVYVFPTDNVALIIGVSAAYAVGIWASVFVYSIVRRASTPGWAKRYTTGVFISTAIFFVGVALTFVVPTGNPVLWVPLAVAAAVPVIAANFLGAGSRR